MAEVITTISPSTNQPVAERTCRTIEQLHDLVTASDQAFQTYRQTTLAQRQAIVSKALDIILEKQNELAQEITEQMGRPISYTAKEVATAVLRGQYLLRTSTEALADTPGDAETGFKRYIRKMPVGPVLVIFAWNYPYLVLFNSLIPALLAGNTVILKPSPQTPTIAEQVVSIFATAGLPGGVLSYFHSGTPSTLSQIVANPRIRLVCFTGSVAGGLAVQQAAASRIVPVGLELGGKDPAYVRRDVDVRWAAEEIVDGAIFNSGQSCCSLERVYVDAAIHDEFVAACQDILKGYILGDPTDTKTQIGPVISKRSLATIQAQIDDALAKGAIDATPENHSFANPPKEGNYIKPTLLTNVTHDMTVMNDETFGPVIPVMKVDSDEEGVRLMNDSTFGLTASIWTKDAETGERLAEQVDAGTVFVNRADYPAPDLAWTGWKDSGRGVTLSRFGFDQFVRLKSFHVKDYPKA